MSKAKRRYMRAMARVLGRQMANALGPVVSFVASREKRDADVALARDYAKQVEEEFWKAIGVKRG